MDNLTVNPVGTSDENRVKKEVTIGPILVDKIYKGEYQKPGTMTAQLKQTVTTKATYPSKSVTSNLQDNPFGLDDFAFEGQVYDSQETRVAWVDVPENATEKSVAAQLAKLPEAKLYRIMSNHPIISDNQSYGISSGVTTKDIIGDRQAVRYPVGHEKEGQLIMDPSGKVQYKGIYFKATAIEDVDLRTKEVSDVYHTATISAEIAASVASSTISEKQTIN